MKKLTVLLEVFRKGKMVTNPEAWKNGQITVNVLSAAILALLTAAQVFGSSYPAILPIVSLLQIHALDIAGVIILVNGMFNPIATVVSSEKVGMRAKPSYSETTTEPRKNPLNGA
jgi:hypothetical protein